MRPKTVFTVVLLAFVGCSIGYLVVGRLATDASVNDSGSVAAIPPEQPKPGLSAANASVAKADSVAEMPPEQPESGPLPASDTKTASPPERTLIAYYFHGNFRCATCRKLEAYSHEAINKGFGQELETGRLQWKVINVDEPQNKHFVKNYQLHTRSLVLVDVESGEVVRHKNLAKIWELVRNKEAFVGYVQDEVRAYLGAG